MSEALLTLDNKPQLLQPGETLLAFIERHKGRKALPTLCDAPNLKPFGSCRLCSVEVATSPDGPWRVVGSCHTPATPGTFVQTHSPRLQRLRRNIVELVLTDHPLECLTCRANGQCELQDAAASVGIRAVRYPAGANHFDAKPDHSHAYMTSDLTKCIQCYRCVRACDEVQGQFVLSMAGRGFGAHIIKGMDQSFADSDCVSCGACAQACPTMAISDVFESAKPDALHHTRTTCTYCGVGCNLLVNAKDGVVKSISAPFEAEANGGHTCVKGRYAFGFYNHKDRLRSPLIKKEGEFVEVSWDEALDFIAAKLKDIKGKYGPDAIAAISSARCTNEENYLMQKFLRAVIGTNNIDGCARVCHAPTALGMQRTFGMGAATNSIADLQHTNCILVIGANATSGHPVTGAKIKQTALSGVPLIVIDPRKTELARYADLHLQLRPGTNVAVLNMMLHHIVHDGLVDEAFVAERCTGFADFKQQILALDLAPLEAVSGISSDLARKAAVMYASAKNAMSFHGLGVTEHSQGTFAVMLIAQLAMLTGNVGRPGVGMNPLRGQNNVQGAADMGVQPHQGAGYLDVTMAENVAHYTAQYHAPVPARKGYKIPEMFDAALEHKLKALWIMGEDVAQTDPNSAKVIAACEAVELLVVQELFMTDTARLADVVLPGSSFLEKSGTFTSGERRIQRVNRVVEPLSGTKPDGEIVVAIMNRMGYAQPAYDPAGLLEEISQVVPFFAGVKWHELGDNGKQWPVTPDGHGTPILHLDAFKIGKAPFFFVDYRESPELEEHAEEFPLILSTVRDLVHYNCGTMTRRTGNVKLKTEDVLLIHPLDAASRQIVDGAKVRVTSARGHVALHAQVSDAVLPGTVSTTFHFPEININHITSDVMDSEAMCPEYKIVAVEVAVEGA